MITEEKIQVFRKKLRREPQGEVKEQMLREGYSEEDIAKVFIPHKYDMRSWLMASGIFISLIGLFVLVKTGGILLLILGGLLFLAYFREAARLKKE
jgi:hypothetical protein